MEKVFRYTYKNKITMPPANIQFAFSVDRQNDTVSISDELIYMRNCLSKFHNQYSTGMSLTLIGGALAGSSYFIKGDERLRSTLGIGDIVMMLIGTATVFDSHKWVAKAGWGIAGKGNTVKIVYRFK